MAYSVIELDPARCTGCGACAQSCPKDCVAMRSDKEGFLAPQIDLDLCIDCGVCISVCPQMNEIRKYAPMECYASKHNDKRVVKESSSGGVFTLLAEEIISRGGAVFGCVFDHNENDRLVAVHKMAQNAQELKPMRGSKYVQSDTKQTYTEAKTCLESGKWVLYTGTPCQIGGLKAFLGKEYEKLVTVDLVCHGVPSPLLFDKSLELIEKQKGKVIDYRFRDKKKGWGLYFCYSYQQNGNGDVRTVRGSKDRSGYYTAFANGDSYRECCYECAYARIERVSDITIADYFGIDLQYPEFSSLDGVSAVLINTEQGKKLSAAVWEQARWLQVSTEDVLQYSDNLKHPSRRTANRDIAYVDIAESAETIFKVRPYRSSLKRRTMALAKEMLPQWLKRRLRMYAYQKSQQ